MPKEAALAWVAASWPYSELQARLKSVLTAVKENPACCRHPQTRFAIGVLCLISYQHTRNRASLSETWERLHQCLTFARYPILFYGENDTRSQLSNDLKWWIKDEELEVLHKLFAPTTARNPHVSNNSLRFHVFSLLSKNLNKLTFDVKSEPLFAYSSKKLPLFFEWNNACDLIPKNIYSWKHWLESPSFQEHLKPFLSQPSKELSYWLCDLMPDEQDHIFKLRDSWGGLDLEDWYSQLIKNAPSEVLGSLDWSVFLDVPYRQVALESLWENPKVLTKAIHEISSISSNTMLEAWDRIFHHMPEQLEKYTSKDDAFLWLKKSVTAFNKKINQLKKANQPLGDWPKYECRWKTWVDAWEIKTQTVPSSPQSRSSFRL